MNYTSLCSTGNGYLHGSSAQSLPRHDEPLSQLSRSEGSEDNEPNEQDEQEDLIVYIDLELDALMARVQLISYRYILL